MSDDITQQYLEARYEEYIEQGFSPKDSALLAQEDLEHMQYDYVPEEEEDDE